MELIKTTTNIDFLGKKVIALIFSSLIIAASVYIWIQRGSGKYGIDFLGGHEIVIKVPGEVDTEKIADVLVKAGLNGAMAQSFEIGSKDVSVRVPLIEKMEAKQVKDTVEQSLKQLYPEGVQVLKTDSVGATIGEEMKRSALMAVAFGLIAILLYVAFRFEFSFALGAVVALFHDVAAATGVYLFAGHDLNSFALAAALTIVGYSVNDTIVIFDRVREEMLKRPAAPLATLINESLNFCLSRTIITSLLTFFSVLALLVFGGGAIQDLSLYLAAGLISGVYSTIYIASPVVLWWEGIRGRKSAVARKRLQGAPS